MKKFITSLAAVTLAASFFTSVAADDTVIANPLLPWEQPTQPAQPEPSKPELDKDGVKKEETTDAEKDLNNILKDPAAKDVDKKEEVKEEKKTEEKKAEEKAPAAKVLPKTSAVK